jgi:hypothetical protein
LCRPRLAGGDREPGPLQDFGEAANRLRARAVESGILERVERDQVELAAHLRGDRQQRARLSSGIVHPFEHHVFERDEVARRALEVAVARAEQLADRILAVDRDDAVAQRIIRCMEGHRERNRAFPGKPVHSRNHTGRGNGDAATRKPVGIVIEHQLQRRDQRVEVEHRLAHAHQHDVRDRPRRALLPAEQAVRDPQRRDDLGGAEVAIEALLPGRAERAIERAAGLARDAERAPTRLGDVHRVDGVRPVDLEQPLARAVRTRAVADDRGRGISASSASRARRLLAISVIASKSFAPRW